jgi:hypothetical protein
MSDLTIIDGKPHIDGVEVTPEQSQEWAHQQSLAIGAALDAERAAQNAARTALSDALALADLYPAPTPEETALIDTQINSALIGFQGLSNPPADVVALAAAVISWRSTL